MPTITTTTRTTRHIHLTDEARPTLTDSDFGEEFRVSDLVEDVTENPNGTTYQVVASGPAVADLALDTKRIMFARYARDEAPEWITSLFTSEER